MSLVLFDGHCGLCSRFVQMMVKRDAKRVFTFIPLQSDKGRQILERSGVPADCDSVVLVESSGQAYVRSRAVLRIFERLGYSWTVRVFSLVPIFILDLVYRFIARHRLLFFGQTNACTLPRDVRPSSERQP